MIRYVKRLWRQNPTRLEERHPIFSHFLFVVSLFAIGVGLIYLVEHVSEFFHEPHLWAILAEAGVILVETSLYILVLLHRLSRWLSRPIPLRKLNDIELPPEDMSESRWRYSIVDPATVNAERAVEESSGLEPYARISESFAHILDAHPELDGKARRELYFKWYSLNRTAFMALEFRNWFGGWSVAAVSIVLPFTADGLADFVSGRIDIRKLDQRDITSPGLLPQALLIDTLIISQRYQKRNWTGRRAFAGLTIRHVAAFWPVPPASWHLLVEPDDPKLERKVLKAMLGFQQCIGREGAPLYILSSTDAPRSKILVDLQKSLSESLRWPLHTTGP